MVISDDCKKIYSSILQMCNEKGLTESLASIDSHVDQSDLYKVRITFVINGKTYGLSRAFSISNEHWLRELLILINKSLDDISLILKES